jgi:hypothetical protein
MRSMMADADPERHYRSRCIADRSRPHVNGRGLDIDNLRLRIDDLRGRLGIHDLRGLLHHDWRRLINNLRSRLVNHLGRCYNSSG